MKNTVDELLLDFKKDFISIVSNHIGQMLNKRCFKDVVKTDKHGKAIIEVDPSVVDDYNACVSNLKGDILGNLEAAVRHTLKFARANTRVAPKTVKSYSDEVSQRRAEGFNRSLSHQSNAWNALGVPDDE